MVAPRKFEEEEVLDRMRDTFWSRGFKATSIQDLERDTELNRSSLYATYGDKTALFLAALKRYGETVSSRARKILSETQGAKALTNMLRARASRVTDPASPDGCLMTRAFIELGTDDGVLGETVRMNAAKAEQAIIAAVERAQEQGDMDRSYAAKDIARVLIAINHGMCVVHSATGDTTAPTRIADTMIKLLGINESQRGDHDDSR
ncbi:MAG: TetR/AcrR family transcriptional regulator [Gammaproteobacteria bacterium]